MFTRAYTLDIHVCIACTQYQYARENIATCIAYMYVLTSK